MSRQRKPTLAEKYYGNIQKLFDENEHLTPDQYQVAPETIHSNEVKNYVTKYRSKLLGSQTPAIVSEENRLPRSSRRTLTQLS